MTELEALSGISAKMDSIIQYLGQIDDLAKGIVTLGITVIVIVILWKFFRIFTD